MYCKILFTAGRGHCDNDSSEDLTPHIPVTRSGRLARKKRPPLESPRVNKAWKKLIPNFQLYSRVVWLVTNFKLDVPVVVSESSGSQLTARCTGCFPQLATFHFRKLRPLRSSDDAYRKWKAVDAGVILINLSHLLTIFICSSEYYLPSLFLVLCMAWAAIARCSY